VRQRLYRSTEELASGRKVLAPSDDPAAAAELQRLREDLAAVEAIRNGLDVARTRLETTDTVLEQATALLIEARTLASRGANSSTEDNLDEIAAEVDALRDSMMALAATRLRGRYIFSGTATDTEPFAPDGTYQGNQDAIEAALDHGTLVTNLPGDEVFRGGPDALTTLSDLASALRDGRLDDIQLAVERLGEAIEHAAARRTVAGTRLRQVDDTTDRLAERTLELARRAEEIGQADLAAAITEMEWARATEQAILSTTARVGRVSLFDFLG
jgi:flagellar hook-associated protein 3 FlgL